MCYGTGGPSGGMGSRAAAAPGARIARRRAVDCTLEEERLERFAREVRASREAHLEERERRIDAMVRQARASGGTEDRLHWTLVYDFEFAPPTTGRAMLLEHRIVPIPPQDLAEGAELHDELWTVIEGLAASGVFLLRTDHLPDRDLYGRLYYRILDEPTRCLPPGSEASEFIDCLHPMDLESGRLGKLLVARDGDGGPSEGAMRAPGVRGPAFAAALADRDRWMPRPAA